MSNKLTRRDLFTQSLATGATLFAASLLAACGGGTAATPTVQKAVSTPAVPATPPTAVPAQPAATVIAASQPAASGTVGEAGAPAPDLIVKPPAGKAPVELRFHMRAGGEKSEPAIYVYRPQEWMEQTGHKVKLEPIPGGKDYIPKIDSLAASGTIGDLTWTSDVWSEHTHLVKFKVLEPVDSFMNTHKIQKDEWFKSITDTLTFEGKMYGFPKTGHPGDAYIFINLKMFRDAGIKEPPTYGNSFDDIRTWANKLAKGPKDNRDVYGYYSGITGLQALTNGVRQYGGDLVDKDGVTSLVNSDEYGAWLNWNYQLVVQDKVHPFSQAIPNGDLAGLFAAEKVAMIHVQRYFQFAARNAVKDKFEFTSIQYPRGPKALGWGASIDTHSTTAASKNKEESLTLT